MKIITYGNCAYTKFIKNFYVNLRNIGIEKLLKIYCLDNLCYEEVCEFAAGAQIIKWEHQANIPSSLLGYGESGYGSIMTEKLNIVYQELSSGNNIFYCDSDIFFYEDPLPHLEQIKEDCSFMLDWNGDACAGLFYAKSSWLCKLILHPRPVDNLKDFDQTLINKRLNWDGIKYNILDPSKFCNGVVWRGGVSKWGYNPIAVHHNAIEPSKKIDDMKYYKHWLI